MTIQRGLDVALEPAAAGGRIVGTGTGSAHGHAGRNEELANARMIRGEPLDWHPDAIFGQFNRALG